MDIAPLSFTLRNSLSLAIGVALSVLLFLALIPAASGFGASADQPSLDEWRTLTAPSADPPRVFTKDDDIRFYFKNGSGIEVFSADWSRVRVPSPDYNVNSAVLRWNQRLARLPQSDRSWREAVVISGAEWRRLATNLIAALAPEAPLHAVYFQIFLADGVLYRDQHGAAHLTPESELPKNVTIDHRFTIEETLEVLARRAEDYLARAHPGRSLFLLLAPNADRVTHPLLIDRQHRRCVWLTPAALYDFTERGLRTTVTAQGLSALLPESHGLALLKNPVSSAARLADLGFATLEKLLYLRLPRFSGRVPPLSHSPGMDLQQWETWLDSYTGTRCEEGSLRLLIDGDQFFTRFHQALGNATNHIHLLVYIFDKDDVAVSIADQLKERSSELDVKVVLDRLGSIGAGVSPPATPLPEDFVPPHSIRSYLKQDSQVHVRTFLNPWLSADHSKVLLVDGVYAWLGGMNLGREYRYEWHDLMVEVRGPVVASLEKDFKRDWAHAGPLGDLAYGASLFDPPKVTEVPTGPGPWIKVRRLPNRTLWKPFSAAVLGSLRKAKSYVYVENPYLFDKRVILALVHAREHGADVRVVLPRVNDFKPGIRGNIVIANYLLDHGVRVYFYPGMTHAKALLVDDWACVGSANLNHLSLRLNQEQNIATSDPAFAAHLKKDLFEADFARSYELTTPISVEWVDLLADLLLEGP